MSLLPNVSETKFFYKLHETVGYKYKFIETFYFHPERIRAPKEPKILL